MKLLNVPPIKVGQYARYAVRDAWYIWKCTRILFNPSHFDDTCLWDIRGTVVSSSWIGYRAGHTIDGYWCEDDTLLTEEETNAIIERTTV